MFPLYWRHLFRNGFCLGFILLLLSGTAATTRATNFVVDTFDHDIAKWLGLATTLAFDPVQDNTGNGGGSCRVTADFATNQSMIFVGTYGPGGVWESNSVCTGRDYELYLTDADGGG